MQLWDIISLCSSNFFRFEQFFPKIFFKKNQNLDCHIFNNIPLSLLIVKIKPDKLCASRCIDLSKIFKLDLLQRTTFPWNHLTFCHGYLIHKRNCFSCCTLQFFFCSYFVSLTCSLTHILACQWLSVPEIKLRLKHVCRLSLLIWLLATIYS